MCALLQAQYTQAHLFTLYLFSPFPSASAFLTFGLNILVLKFRIY